MRTPFDIPPAGPALPFLIWAETVTRYLRRRLPEVKAVRKGPTPRPGEVDQRIIIWRHLERTATLRNDNGAYCISFKDTQIGVTMSGLCDYDRHDDFVAANIAKSLAGFFDASLSQPDTPEQAQRYRG